MQTSGNNGTLKPWMDQPNNNISGDATMRMKLMIALPLMLLGLQAHAQTSTAPTTGTAPVTDACTAHPEACAANAQAMQQRCQANPAACAQVKQNLSTACANHAQGCTDVKNRLQANQAAVQSYNSSNPNAAQQEANAGSRMANREERRAERRQKWAGSQGGTSGTTTPQQ
jgi:hypothetical protein